MKNRLRIAMLLIAAILFSLPGFASSVKLCLDSCRTHFISQDSPHHDCHATAASGHEARLPINAAHLDPGLIADQDGDCCGSCIDLTITASVITLPQRNDSPLPDQAAMPPALLPLQQDFFVAATAGSRLVDLPPLLPSPVVAAHRSVVLLI